MIEKVILVERKATDGDSYVFGIFTDSETMEQNVNDFCSTFPEYQKDRDFYFTEITLNTRIPGNG